MNELLCDLFISDKRQMVDSEIRRILTDYTANGELRQNLLYHMCLDDDSITPTFAHSKRLRSYLCLLIGEENSRNLEKVLPLAVTIELLHNATLLVDDVQDGDTIRCGKPALWSKVGIAQAMNASFFLANIAQAYYHKARLSQNLGDFTDRLIRCIDSLFDGQQIDICVKPLPEKNTLALYQKMVHGKTGALLSLACVMGAYPDGMYVASNVVLLERFATQFALLHQLQDDFSDLDSLLFSAYPDCVGAGGNILSFFPHVENHGLVAEAEKRSLLLSKLAIYYTKEEAELEESLNNLYDHQLLNTDTMRRLAAAISENGRDALSNLIAGAKNHG